MKIAVVLAVLLVSLVSLVACGGGVSPSSAWPDRSVAPDFAVVPPQSSSFVLDTPSDRFGVGVVGQVEVVEVGYAAASSEPLKFFTDGVAGPGSVFECEASENPVAGTLFVYAVDVFGMEYVALVEYEPGVNDGWYLSRNDLWFE